MAEQRERVHSQAMSSADSGRKRWSSRLKFGLAVGAVLGAGAATIVSLQEDDAGDPADSIQMFGEASALASADAFFEGYNAGDDQGVLTSLTPDGIADVAFDYGFPDFTDAGAPFDRWMRRQNPDQADGIE